MVVVSSISILLLVVIVVVAVLMVLVMLVVVVVVNPDVPQGRVLCFMAIYVRLITGYLAVTITV
jgi:hypothetical protein